MNGVKISPPWTTYYRELVELFKKDKEIFIEHDEDKNVIEITTTKYEKSLALKKVLPCEKDFGGTKLKINIVYKEPKMDAINAFKELAINNPVFKYTYVFPTSANPIAYVVFAKEVVQYWNDDMSDPHGITSTLYENLAREVFAENLGIIFSTDSDKTLAWMKAFEKEYIRTHATQEEIEEWEEYNGEGSFDDGSSISKTLLDKDKLEKDATPVKDVKTFKSIFRK